MTQTVCCKHLSVYRQTSWFNFDLLCLLHAHSLYTGLDHLAKTPCVSSPDALCSADVVLPENIVVKTDRNYGKNYENETQDLTKPEISFQIQCFLII